MKKFRTVLFVLLACFCACTKDKKPQITNIVGYDNPMRENGEGIKYLDFYVTKLDAPSEIDISSIQKIDFLDDYIIVQNTKGVYCFDKDGKFIRQYGTKGHGPGEYVQVGGMIVNDNKKTISIYDSYSCSLNNYSVDGKYLTTKRLKTDALNLMFSGEYYDEDNLFVNYFLYKSQKLAFALCDMETFERSGVKSYDMSASTSAERSGMHAYDIRDGVVKYVLPFKNEVYCYNMQDSFPIYLVQTKKDILDSDELLKKEYHSTINFDYIQNEDIFLGFNDIFEMESYIFLNTLYNSYFLVNKETMIGQRYSNFNFEINPLKYLPILNICAESNGYLVGVVNSDELEMLEFEDNNTDKFLNILKQCADNKEDEKIYLLHYKI